MGNMQKKINIKKNTWLCGHQQIFLNYMYEQYLQNPDILDISWKDAFKKINTSQFNLDINNIDNINNVSIKYKIKYIKEKLLNFLNSYRTIGHYNANINPLNKDNCSLNAQLSLSFHKLRLNDWNIIKNNIFFSKENHFLSLIDVKNFYKKIYCNTIGFEFMFLKNFSEKKWLQEYIEEKYIKQEFSRQKRICILKNLIHAQTFEKFMNNKFLGKKRFSLEGCDVLIPLLHEVINFSFKKKIKKIFLGMAHRGRLNVIFNLLDINVPKKFNTFKKKFQYFSNTGDVKYHMGYTKYFLKKEKKVKLILLHNPSHLEIITPVVLGYCRSEIDNIAKNDKELNFLPIIIHGDAAFTGQGVIQETLNMSKVPAYSISGCIHIIINNQIGFTTSKKKYLRSSQYCTDIAKFIDSPIFHVNADDPEAVIFTIKLALNFRIFFKKDVFIDLVCYRRLGHNEVDDPFITQPLMYQKIQNHLNIVDIYNQKHFIKNNKYQNIKNIIYQEYIKKLNTCISEIDSKKRISEKNYSSIKLKKNISSLLKKNFSLNEIKKISEKIFLLPKNLHIHHQVKKIYANRLNMAKGIINWDWGAVEILAYATLLNQGISCRLTGEDVSRGTFSHRHILIYCQKTGTIYNPLHQINNTNARINIWDSVLSEESTLAFEYGYSVNKKNVLNIWEAQFGDFANGAQVVIDQFLVSSKQKWKIDSSLVMMLPHGNEGQGPEHSSARIERYLQLCAQNNILVCNPTTTGQFYHLLRRHGLNQNKNPLIIFTPKSLLRNPVTFSSLENLSNDKFHYILLSHYLSVKNIKKIIFCTGKIYYDLLQYKNKIKKENILLIRIEQLYPFPKIKFISILNKFIYVKNYIWCQEEPKNQGAWTYFYFYFKKNSPFLNKKIKLFYVGRPKWASTAEGDIETYKNFQNQIINNVFHKKF